MPFIRGSAIVSPLPERGELVHFFRAWSIWPRNSSKHKTRMNKGLEVKFFKSGQVISEALGGVRCEAVFAHKRVGGQ